MELSTRLKRVYISTFSLWLGNYYHVQISSMLRLRNIYMEFIYVLRRLRLKFTIKIFHIFNQILRVDFLLYNRSNSILNVENNFLQQRTCVKELHIT